MRNNLTLFLVVLYPSPKRMKKIKAVEEFILQETYANMSSMLRKVLAKHWLSLIGVFSTVKSNCLKTKMVSTCLFKINEFKLIWQEYGRIEL
jgi:hypothetical protein